MGIHKPLVPTGAKHLRSFAHETLGFPITRTAWPLFQRKGASLLSKTHIFLDVLETCNVLVPQYDYTSLDSSLSKRQKQAPQMICHSIADGARHGLELHLPRQMASARHGWFFEVCCFRMRKNESPRRSQSTLDVCQTKVCCFWMSQSLTFPQHGKKKNNIFWVSVVDDGPRTCSLWARFPVVDPFQKEGCWCLAGSPGLPVLSGTWRPLIFLLWVELLMLPSLRHHLGGGLDSMPMLTFLRDELCSMQLSVSIRGEQLPLGWLRCVRGDEAVSDAANSHGSIIECFIWWDEWWPAKTKDSQQRLLKKDSFAYWTLRRLRQKTTFDILSVFTLVLRCIEKLRSLTSVLQICSTSWGFEIHKKRKTTQHMDLPYQCLVHGHITL